ncbi:TetR/AcrR family transcriptional regulator [Kitasatospora sp. NPDC101183]|uniref:TetR/AcrR family transcriptional regulator n=1 Tax=Kitasatospora sp. NPDC101183 TaxID=3364100 RepID=UPI00381CB100
MGAKGDETRARLIAGTRALIEAQGYHGTGLNRILADTGTPRGSLYFHFPEGKDQLVAAALLQAGRETEELLTSRAERGATAAELAEALAEAFAERLHRSAYRTGCPIATVALDVSGANEPLRAVCAEVYDGWRDVLARRLAAEGRPTGAAGQALALIEGAALLAKVRRDLEPLDDARTAVLRLLSGAP